VLFEWTRNADQTYNFYVYLGGKSQKYYRASTHDQDHHWIQPVICYKNIPVADFFFHDKEQRIQSDFFQVILETAASGGRFSPEFLSLHLLGHLQKYRDEEIAPRDAISQPRATTDGWSSVKGLVLRYLGHDQYKKTMLKLKFNTLIEGYGLYKDNLAKDRKD